MADYKNTREVFEFLDYAAPLLIKALKDGAQITDLAVLMDQALWAKAQAAVADVGLISAEMNPMTLDKAEYLIHESIDLGKAVVNALKA